MLVVAGLGIIGSTLSLALLREANAGPSTEDAACLARGRLKFQEVAAPAFELGEKVEPADRLPDAWLGRWVVSHDADSEFYVSRNTLIRWDRSYNREPKSEMDISALGNSYQVQGRVGQRFSVRYGKDGAVRRLEMVGEALHMGTRFDAETQQTMKCLLGGTGDLRGDGWFVKRLVRPPPPTSASSWADRALHVLEQGLHHTALIDAAEQALRLAWWPFRTVEVLDIYPILWGQRVNIVVHYRADDQERLWTSLVSPNGLAASGDLLTSSPVPRIGRHLRALDVGAPSLLDAWAQQHIVPQLPASAVE